jgi:hypothetical protein
MKNENPYSKYRYDNTFALKYRSNNYKVQDMFGADQKSYRNTLGNQLDQQVASSPWGITWVIANVFKATRITNVDTSIVPSTYKGPTYFKPFKL